MSASGTTRSVSRLPGITAAALGGLAVAGVATAAGFAVDRLSRDRKQALALDAALEPELRQYDDTADELPVVVSSDGVILHVEVDHPSPTAPPPARGIVRPTVVFSHGYCLSLRCWVFQRRALRAAGYRVVLWDQRGHGKSGAGESDRNTIDQLGDDLARVIAAAAPTGPLVLVGHSMGGMTMMSLALAHEELLRARVVGAAFVATSPGRMGEVSFGFIRPVGVLIHRLAPLASATLASQQRIVDGTLKMGRDLVDLFVDKGSFGSPVPLSIAQLTTDMIFGTRMDIISSFMPRFSEHDKLEALSRYQGIEALVINGTGDRLTPPDHSEEIVRQLPGAEHVVVHEAGHIIMLEHPDLVADQIVDLVGRAERSHAHAGDPIEEPGISTTKHITDILARRRARRALSQAERRARDTVPAAEDSP